MDPNLARCIPLLDLERGAMKITREEVEHVAELARLTFHEDETASLTGQLNHILEYIAQLEEVDTRDVEPTAHVIEVVNAFRKDEVRPSIPVEDALSNAPEREGDAFAVPRII